MKQSYVSLVAIVGLSLTLNQSLSAQEVVNKALYSELAWKNQKTPQLHLGMEIGFNGFFGVTNKPAMIRENRSSYYYYNDYDYYDFYYDDYRIYDAQDVFFFYFGAKTEYRLSKHNRFTVATGLRYSLGTATLMSDRNHFLWKISETGMNSNYVRIKSITPKSHHIGIPLELRFFPRRKDSFVRQYFIFGKSFNFLLASDSDISFENSAMNKYSSTVAEHIEKPCFFQGKISAGIGLKIGSENRPHVRIECYMPTVAYGTGKMNAFVKSSAAMGMGMFASLQIPISSYNKEQSKLDQ